MPEEINRIMTDHVSKFLLCPTETAIKNLEKEGIKNGIIRVQDPMFLTVNYFKDIALKNNYIEKLSLFKNNYYFATIHRPSNTDTKEQLESIFTLFNSLNKKVLIPLHPRTKNKINEFNIDL
jgi:UDP-N-acetylglucosamine 2-epimerase